MRLQKVGSFDAPVYVTSPPGDEQPPVRRRAGRDVRVVKGGKTLGTPFLDVSDKLTTGSEQGLLSIAFAPDYASSGLFYVFYTDTDGDEAVVEYKRRSEDVADPGSARQLLKVADPEPNHNGGLLLFGPDKRLYIGIGDGGGGGRPARLARQRPVARHAAGQDPADRPARPAGRARTRSRPTTRSWAARAPRARSTATACATRGGSRSTARPAT